MSTSEFSIVPLRQASLCLDCDMITSAHTHCFVCGSGALMSLARTLNGNVNAKQGRPELFVINKHSPRPKLPVSVNIRRYSHADRRKYASLRSVLSSVLLRPIGDQGAD